MPHLTTVQLHTSPGKLHPEVFETNSGNPAHFELVIGLSLPNGTFIENPRHTRRQPQYLYAIEEPRVDTITLPSERAERLANMFATLREGHENQCHDLLGAVFDVEHRRLGEVLDSPLEAAVDTPKPGVPYAVLSQPPYNPEKFRFTHSAIGMDSGRLLSILGHGSMFGIMTAQDTLSLHSYNSGGQAHIVAHTFAE